MRRILPLLFFCLLSFLAMAQQAPQGISYQAVLRNDYGIPMGDRDVNVRVSILDAQNDYLYYQESHQVRVAPEGTFNLVIGQGQRLDGNFRTIPWSVGQMWAEIEYDLDGRGQYQSSGTMQLLSVPYALYAQSAGVILDDFDTELGADTRDDSQVVERYWKTNGNELLPNSIAYFYPDSIINNQDIIPQFLGTTTMQPLMIRTGDTLRAFFLPVGDFYVLYDQYNLGDLEIRGASTLWGPVVAKSGIEASVGQFFNVFVDNNVVIDKDLRVKRDAQIDRDVRIGRDLDVDGIARFNNTTQSTTKDNGAVIVEGGVGIEKNLNVGGNTSLAGDLNLGGKLTINDATESTATNNGALIVAGGVGIGKRLNVGGVTRVWNSTESSSTTNGALIVDGGIGIAKRAYIGGNLRVENMASTYLTGGLTVDKATDLNATLNVDGATTLNSTLAANGQVTISTLVTGGQSEYNAYPLRVQGSQQGIAIKLNPAFPNETNNFVTFFDGNTSAVGRIEGQSGLSGIVRQVAIDIVGDADFDDALGGSTDNEQDPQANPTFGDYMGSNYAFAAINATVDFVYTIFAFAVNLAAAGLACIGGDCDDAVWSFIDMVKTGAQLAAFIVMSEVNIGVTYESGSADYAEWLMRYDSTEVIQFGEVVGVRGGQISKTFEAAESYMVISDKPGVLGGMPEKGKEHLYEKVAFMGQVPVKVLGEVHIGDYILPSGNEDGMAIAVNPQDARVYDYKRIIGVAWSASLPNTMVSFINVAVGLQQNQLADVVEQMQGVMNEMQLAIARLSPDYKPFYFETQQSGRPDRALTEWTELPAEVQLKQNLTSGAYPNFQSRIEDMKAFAASYGFDYHDYPLLGEFMDNPTQENAEALRDYYGKALERGQQMIQTYKEARKG